jgi:tetratricopeptide (TPR) repeat protein
MATVWAVALFVLLSPAADGQRKKGTESPSSNETLRESERHFTEAEKFLILEDYAKALMYFQKSLEVFPGNAAAHYKVAEILSRSEKQEDLAKAAASIENALRFEKDNRYYYLLGVQIYSAVGNLSRTVEMYELMLSNVKDSEEYLFELAAVHMYNQQPEQALKVYTRAESHFGVNEISSLQKQRIYFEQGKVREAIAEGDKLLAAYPDENRFVMAYAEALSQYGKADVAIQKLESYLEVHPDASAVRMLLAGFYQETGQQARSLPLIRAIIEDPELELNSKLIVMSTLQTQAGKDATASDRDFAFGLLNTLLRLHPNEPRVIFLAGDMYAGAERKMEALAYYRTGRHSGEATYEVYQNLLLLESELGQFDSLIVHADEALELYPNQGMIYYLQGFAYLRKYDHKKAAYSLEAARKLSSSNATLTAQINAMLGDAYYGAKEYAKSYAAFDAALALNPNDEIVLNNYSYYLALRKEKLDRADRMASQLIREHPDQAAYLDTYAWVLFAQEKYKEAQKVMEKVLTLPGANATHYEHYGDILFKLGRIDDAVKYWNTARTSAGSKSDLLDKKIADRKYYEQ